jgi:hypothetical protein
VRLSRRGGGRVRFPERGKGDRWKKGEERRGEWGSSCWGRFLEILLYSSDGARDLFPSGMFMWY